MTSITVKPIINVSKSLFEGYSYNQAGKPVKVMKLAKPIAIHKNYNKLTNTTRPLEFGYARVPAALIITSDNDLKDNKLDTDIVNYIPYKSNTVVRHGKYVRYNTQGIDIIQAIYNNGLPTEATFYFDQDLSLTINYNKYGLPVLYTTKIEPSLAFNGPIITSKDNWCTIWSKKKLSTPSIDIRRQLIAEEMSKKYPATIGTFMIQAAMIQDLFDLYDKYFFNNTIKSLFVANKIAVSFEISNRMTSTAGSCKTLSHQCSYVITLSTLFNNLFTSTPVTKSLDANGIICDNQMMCIQVVFEHELLHLLIDTMCPTENKLRRQPSLHKVIKKQVAGGVVLKEVRDMHGDTFKMLINNIFGHTKTRHGLLSGDAETYQKKVEEQVLARESKRQEMKAALSPGMVVTVNDRKYGKWQGIVTGNIRSNSVRVAIEPLDKTKPKMIVPLTWITY